MNDHAHVLYDASLRIAPGYRMQWESAQNSHVLLFPEGMITLNPTASEILQYCDGTRTVRQVLDELASKYPEGGAELETDVLEFLEYAYDRGWIAE